MELLISKLSKSPKDLEKIYDLCIQNKIQGTGITNLYLVNDPKYLYKNKTDFYNQIAIRPFQEKDLQMYMKLDKDMNDMLKPGELLHKRAYLSFNNGIALSIIQGKFFYSRDENEYEVAVFYKDEWITRDICERLHDQTGLEINHGNDVIGYLDFNDVYNLIKDIASFKDYILPKIKRINL